MQVSSISFFSDLKDTLFEKIPEAKPYNLKQITLWFGRGVYDFSLMTDLSLNLRTHLRGEFNNPFSSEVATFLSADDGSFKVALRLHDSEVVECVLLKNSDKTYTACLSSQVGCPMGCEFCRTGKMKLKRNLSDYEIVEEFAHLHDICVNKYNSTISHIVFMGMGEPLLNVSNLVLSIEKIREIYKLGYRRITVSTCGVLPGIRELEKLNVPVKLAVSLVSADNEMRSRLMPVNRTYGLSSLKSELLNYQRIYKRRITLEYCMIHGVNLSSRCADLLYKFIKGLNVLVNLIPLNYTPDLDYKSPDYDEVMFFRRCLDNLNITYTVRNSKGSEILGACGQLAGTYSQVTCI